MQLTQYNSLHLQSTNKERKETNKPRSRELKTGLPKLAHVYKRPVDLVKMQVLSHRAAEGPEVLHG